ncbi:MAG: hypothetical protein DDT33_00850 [Firmicutes bacterium]|nr:hypothetical protein [Bacillota bacterium]
MVLLDALALLRMFSMAVIILSKRSEEVQQKIKKINVAIRGSKTGSEDRLGVVSPSVDGKTVPMMKVGVVDDNFFDAREGGGILPPFF